MAAKTLLHTLAIILFAGTVGLGVARAQQIGTTALQVSIGPECEVTISSSTSTSLPDAYIGKIDFNYRLRTSRVGGSGAIELALAGRDLGDATLTYTTTLTGRGDARSGSDLRAVNGPAAIALFGANTRTLRSGDTGSVAWALRKYRGAPPAVQLSMRCR